MKYPIIFLTFLIFLQCICKKPEISETNADPRTFTIENMDHYIDVFARDKTTNEFFSYMEQYPNDNETSIKINVTMEESGEATSDQIKEDSKTVVFEVSMPNTTTINNKNVYVEIGSSIDGLLSLFMIDEEPNFISDKYLYSFVQYDNENRRKTVFNKIISDSNKFWVTANCQKNCKGLSLKFKFVEKSDTITLSKTESFSMLVNNTKTHKYIIDNPNNDEPLVIICYGTDTLKMKVNDKEADIKFKDGVGFVLQDSTPKIDVEVTAEANNYYTITSYYKNKLEIKPDVLPYHLVIDETDTDIKYSIQLSGNNYKFAVTRNGELKVYGETQTEPRVLYDLKVSGDTGEIIVNSHEKQGIIISIQNEESRKNIKQIIDEPVINKLLYKERLTKGAYKIYRQSEYLPYDEQKKNTNTHTLSVQEKQGKIEVYKDSCSQFPNCEYNKDIIDEKKRLILYEFTDLFGPLNHYSVTLEDQLGHNLGSPEQEYLIVYCKPDIEGNECQYNVFMNKVSEKRMLDFNDAISKFIPGKKAEMVFLDSYELPKYKEKSKTIIDLLVYSGDAYFTDFKSDKCQFNLFHLGSNQKYILDCEVDGTVSFNIKGNLDSFYHLSVGTTSDDLKKPNEEDQDLLKQGVTMMQALISSSERSINLLSSNRNKNQKVLINIHPIDCTLACKFKKKSSEVFSDFSKVEYHNMYQAVVDTEEDIQLKIRVDQMHHYSDIMCHYYISSYDLNDEGSYLTIPEAKPFMFTLNKKLQKVKVVFPFGVRNENDESIYLRLDLNKFTQVKMTESISYNNLTEHYFFESREFVLAENFRGCPLYSACKVELTFELTNAEGELQDDEQSVIELIMKTYKEVPFSIESEKFYSDIFQKAKHQYYLATVFAGDRVEVDFNYKRGGGVIYAKIVEAKNATDEDGWNGRIKLPNENDTMTDNSTQDIYFDFYRQKLVIRREATENICENYCYLVFGLASTDKYTFEELSNEMHSQFTLYYKRFPSEEFAKPPPVKMLNNEILTGSINTDSTEIMSNREEYFMYLIQEEIPFMRIEYFSDTCDLYLGFHKKVFDTKISSTGQSKMLIFSKEDIYKKKTDKKTKNTMLYILVSNVGKSGIYDSKFKIKISIPATKNPDLTYSNLVNTDNPVYCEYSLMKGYCDYVVPIYYDQIDLQFYGMGSKFGKTAVYIKYISSNDYGKYDNLKWPDRQNPDSYQYPEDKKKTNFIVVSSTDIPESTCVFLVRVYNDNNNQKEGINLITGDFYFIEKTIPAPGDYMIFNIDYSNVTISIPEDHNYLTQFMIIKGQANLQTQNDKNYLLYHELDTIKITAQKGNNNFLFSRSSEETTYILAIYKIRPQNQNLDEVDTAEGSSISYDNQDFPVKLYTTISDIQTDYTLSLSINELNKVETNDAVDIQDTFKVTGYLVTQLQLQEMKKEGGVRYTEHLIEGQYDIATRTAFLPVSYNKIKEFNNQHTNSDNYVILYIEKTPENKFHYNRIYGFISSFESTNTIRMLKPSYPVHGYHDKTTNYLPIYMLGKDDPSDIKIEVEFSCSHNFVKPIVVKDINDKDEATEYFKVERLTVAGKHIIRLNQNIDLAFLKIIKTSNVEESFTYFIKYKADQGNYANYDINPTLQVKYDANSAHVTEISFKKPSKNGKLLTKSEYYVRVYNMPYVETQNKNYLIPQNSLAAFTIKDEKISEANMVIKGNFPVKDKNHYIDVLVVDKEDANDATLFAYTRVYPYTGKGEEKSSGLSKGAIIGIAVGSGILVILLIIAIIIAVRYKKKYTDLEDRVKTIEFNEIKTKEQDDTLLVK